MRSRSFAPASAPSCGVVSDPGLGELDAADVQHTEERLQRGHLPAGLPARLPRGPERERHARPRRGVRERADRRRARGRAHEARVEPDGAAAERACQDGARDEVSVDVRDDEAEAELEPPWRRGRGGRGLRTIKGAGVTGAGAIGLAGNVTAGVRIRVEVRLPGCDDDGGGRSEIVARALERELARRELVRVGAEQHEAQGRVVA